jgi:protein-S-isoprenylcysteine O-methyltransferase Ste14
MVVAGVVPWLLTGWESGARPAILLPAIVLGAVMAIAGGGVLVHSFLRFVVEGVGTPAPVAPPQHLVVGGLFRYVRNPMYVAVLATIAGQALLLWRPVLLLYGAAVGICVAAFVRFYEEPALSRRFGVEYDEYRRAVPRWIPRLRT